MKWYSVDINSDSGAEEFIWFLKRDGLKFETSDLDNGGKHFEIYCDKFAANRLDVALDLVYDHMAERENGRLNEANGESREDIIKAIQNNATYKKAKSIAEKYGYAIDPYCYVEVFNNGYKWVRFNVRAIDRRSYDPEIYYDANEPKNKFRIQTTSYGSLEMNEYEQFLKSVTAAYDMVKELIELDLFTLYEVPHDEE